MTQDNLYIVLRYQGLSEDSNVIVDEPSSNLLVALVALVMVLNSHVAGRDVVLC